MKRMVLGWLSALAVGFGPTPALAAADYFLKLEGVAGELTGAGPEGSLAVASWSFGASNPTSVGSSGMSAGRSSAAPSAEPTPGSSGSLTVVKQYDKSSPKLAKHCASGNHIASAQLKRCENGACRSYELKDVVISSVTLTSDGGGGATEQLTLNYTKIEYAHEPKGTLRESPSRPSQGTTSSGPAKPKPN